MKPMVSISKRKSNMRSESRRSQLDHERYLRERDRRLKKQKEYYQAHKELYGSKYRAQIYEERKKVNEI